MSEKRDLWVPALLAIAGIGVAAWDVTSGDVTRGILALLVGLATSAAALALLLRHGAGRALSFATAGFLLLALLSPIGRGATTSILPWALGLFALAFLPRRLPLGLRRALLVVAGVLAVVALLAAIRVIPPRLLSFAAVGALACASAVIAARPRPEPGPPPGPRVGVFGGTFDPFHRGHRAICEAALKALDRVLVVVSGQPPHKQEREPTPFHHRVAMARLGVEGLPRIEVLEVEGRRAGPSYTVDTLEGLRKTFAPGTRFLLVVGADAFQDLPLWHRWEDILENASLLVAARPGFDLDPPPELEGRSASIERLEAASVDASSRDIRARIAEGRDVGDRLSPAVSAYVRDHGLYRPEGAVPEAPAARERPGRAS